MSLDDPNDDREDYRKERQRVRDADVPETDRAALLAFGDHKDDAGATSTAVRQLNYARRCAEMAADTDTPPLTTWGQGDFERFHARLKNGEVPDFYLRHCGPNGWGEGSLRNFKNALKQLLLYVGAHDDDDRAWTDDDDRDWLDAIELGAAPKPKVDPADLLAPDELAAMWSAIDNLRDRAMFALLSCTWQRSAVVRSFRVRDVTLHSSVEGVIRIYADALGRKGAEGRKPLSWAVAPVKEWLDAHPTGGDDDPLICVTGDAGDADEGAPLSTANAVNRRLLLWAKRAGLDRDRWDRSYGRKQRTVRAHLLRYTGAVRAAKSDEYSESTVKKWGGWTQSSDQLDRYILLTDDDVLASWASAHDINTGVFDSAQPEFGNCGRCSGPIEDWLPACPACGHEPSEPVPETDVTPEQVRGVDPTAVKGLFEAAIDAIAEEGGTIPTEMVEAAQQLNTGTGEVAYQGLGGPDD